MGPPSLPETRYARSGDVNVAYQVHGTGPPDVIVAPGALSHLEAEWEHPDYARFFLRIGSFARVIRFDKRGTGMSDRVADSALPTLEERMDDLRAVMDAVRAERATVVGISEGGALAALFAATHPGRTTSLVLYGAEVWDPPPPKDRLEAAFARIRESWGTEAEARRSLARYAPSVADDPAWIRWEGRVNRLSASPGAVISLIRMNVDIDIRPVLGAIHVPTIVLHRLGDRVIGVQQGRLLARSIPGARLVELPGEDHYPWVGEQEAILDEIEEVVTGVRDPLERDRVLATILFVDIVDSTAMALEFGDRRWRDLLVRHQTAMRRELKRFRGQELDTAGDGLLASFDGPARGVRCATRMVAAARQLGLEIRAGLHTGECELHGTKLAGVAVHTGARIASLAVPGEVLVSSTVRDLVAGSGLVFDDRGERDLKGLPGTWRLFAAVV